MENYLFEKMSVPKAYMKLALPVVLSMIVVSVQSYYYSVHRFSDY